MEVHIMRNHRNVQKEFESIIAAYAYINHKWNVVDITTFDNAKKAKYNRFLSLVGWMAKHTSALRIILAYVPWDVPHMSFRYVVEDLKNIFNYMRQHSGACYIVKVTYIEDHKIAVRLIPVSKKDHVTIHTTIVEYLKEDYEFGVWNRKKKYWQ